MRIINEAPDTSNNTLLNFITGRPRRLAHTDRYSTTPLVGRETVSEHSFFVALYARVLCDYVPCRVDRRKVMERALFHDIDETISGDIIHAFKYSGQLKEEIEKVNKRLIKKAFHDIKNKDYYIKTWKNAKDKSIEGYIIKLADNLSVLSFALEEISLGNKYMEIIRDNTIEVLRRISETEHFEFLKNLVEELERIANE